MKHNMICPTNSDQRGSSQQEALPPTSVISCSSDLDEGMNSFCSVEFLKQLIFRICPGRYLADASVWMALATILATLHLEKAKSPQGNDILVDWEYTDTLIW